MTTNDEQYVPSEDDMRETWVDHESKCMWEPHPGDPSAEFDRFLARVRRDAAREALDGLAAEAREGIANRETTWGHGQAIATAADTYLDTHYPVTVHPNDIEALLDRLRRNTQAPMGRFDRLNGMGGFPEYGEDERPFPDEVLKLLDLLATAEHRATRAEAQSAVRGRAVVIYRERAREAEARIEAWEKQYDHDLAQADLIADQAEARIKAVQDVLDQHESILGDSLGVPVERIRRALDG